MRAGCGYRPIRPMNQWKLGNSGSVKNNENLPWAYRLVGDASAVVTIGSVDEADFDASTLT